MVSCPRGPQPRKPIRSGENHSPLSSQVLKCAKVNALTMKLDKDGDGYNYDYDDKDDDDTGSKVGAEVKDTLGTGSSCLPYTPESAILILCAIAAVLLGFVGYLYVYPTQDTGKGLPLSDIKALEKEREQSLQKDIRHIREEFPSQLDNIWVAFSAGIKETARGIPTKPSVFMLLYETEEGTPICLAQKIGNISTHFLNAVKSHPLLIIQGADFEHNETLAEDYGVLLEEYRPKVEEQRTMIVNNLHKIPGTVAQSFQSFCDTVTPAVAKAVYFFTMKASGVTGNRDNPTAVAEKELRKLWSDKLVEDILNPLITRITDTTMMIKPEKNLAPCES